MPTVFIFSLLQLCTIKSTVDRQPRVYLALCLQPSAWMSFQCIVGFSTCLNGAMPQQCGGTDSICGTHCMKFEARKRRKERNLLRLLLKSTSNGTAVSKWQPDYKNWSFSNNIWPAR